MGVHLTVSICVHSCAQTLLLRQTPPLVALRTQLVTASRLRLGLTALVCAKWPLVKPSARQRQNSQTTSALGSSSTKLSTAKDGVACFTKLLAEVSFNYKFPWTRAAQPLPAHMND